MREILLIKYLNHSTFHILSYILTLFHPFVHNNGKSGKNTKTCYYVGESKNWAIYHNFFFADVRDRAKSLFSILNYTISIPLIMLSAFLKKFSTISCITRKLNFRKKWPSSPSYKENCAIGAGELGPSCQ